MGGIGKTLFGSPEKKKEKSESGNHAWDEIDSAFTPALNYVTNAGDTAWNLLKGGPQGFADSGGMQFLLDTMQKGVTSSKAAQGLLKSGSYGTALQDRAMNIGSTYLNQYMDQLFKLGGLGTSAGAIMSDAGKWSKGEGSATGAKKGIAGDLLKAGAVIAACDPRLKLNVVKIGKRSDGLEVFEWTYDQNAPIKLPKGKFRGVMADQVAGLRPELLGEPVMGYLTVKEELRPERIG